MALARRSGTWTGSEFADLAVYLRTTVEARHPIHVVLQSTCGCRETAFRLEVDPEEGCACRACTACGAQAHIADSNERWPQAEPVPAVCACGGERFELGVAFSFRGDGEVRWITVGRRCLRCARLDCAADWEIDGRGTEHLLERA